MNNQNNGQMLSVIQFEGIIDVTNLDDESPDGSLGYVAKCTIKLLPEGKIVFLSMDNNVLEELILLDIIRGTNNINNYDPDYVTDISLMTYEKKIRISFETLEKKREFWNCLMDVYDKNKYRR